MSIKLPTNYHEIFFLQLLISTLKPDASSEQNGSAGKGAQSTSKPYEFISGTHGKVEGKNQWHNVDL